jgi:hypothetical protein
VESIDRGEKNTKLKKRRERSYMSVCKSGYTSDVNLEKGKDKYQSTTALCGQITQRQKVGVSVS